MSVFAIHPRSRGAATTAVRDAALQKAREETGAAHARLDGMLSSQRLSSVYGAHSFFRTHQEALGRLLAIWPMGGAADHRAAAVAMARAVAVDADRLSVVLRFCDQDAPTPMRRPRRRAVDRIRDGWTAPPRTSEGFLGVAYVLAGSGLGARKINLVMAASADPDVRAATSYSDWALEAAWWPALRADAALLVTDDEIRRFVGGAKYAFAAYIGALNALSARRER